jgi:hypothetical protein
MFFKSMEGTLFKGSLLLPGILALLLVACGGSDGGNNGIASANQGQCTLTAEELDNLTPDDVDSLPKACDGIGFFDVPSIDGLFILGTEIDGATGELKLYVHGVKGNGSPMTLTDFQQAAVTVGGFAVNRPADWDVAPVPAGVLSMGLLADYSTSITDVDLSALGGLYDTILNAAPTEFEAEIINFSTLNLAPSITIKPEPAPYWTEALPALLAATDVDPDQPRENTPLYDAMGTGLLGPIGVVDSDPGDGLGLVERGRPATLLIAQTDGKDTASLMMQIDDITSLIERCHTTVIMLGTLRSEVDAQVLDELAGTRGAAVNALNTNFLEEAIGPYAESLGNLVVFTLSPDTGFAGKTVEISAGGEAASAVEPFDIDASCQL